mgnify:CR=1 FL=1
MTDRQTTHAQGCWDWGPKHYECAVAEIGLLRKMLQSAFQRGYQIGARGLREIIARWDADCGSRMAAELPDAIEAARELIAEEMEIPQ